MFQSAGILFLVVALSQAVLAATTGRGWAVGVCAVSAMLGGGALLVARRGHRS
jgi:hypothetical protein